MLSLPDNNQANFEAFNSTSRYLDDLLDIDNPCFRQIVSQIYPTELQIMKHPFWNWIFETLIMFILTIW